MSETSNERRYYVAIRHQKHGWVYIAWGQKPARRGEHNYDKSPSDAVPMNAKTALDFVRTKLGHMTKKRIRIVRANEAYALR